MPKSWTHVPPSISTKSFKTPKKVIDWVITVNLTLTLDQEELSSNFLCEPPFLIEQYVPVIQQQTSVFFLQEWHLNC